ncbi:MAG: tyrosine-type recombinase/integrase [Hydrogenovibrio sp.]|uniref:tyrosine-type recombinase/integrase n=1 Tax=Hydrogenovibrio sp. TaxID=2065821 RepID=UPI0028705B25|nr:integrase arm-type DNA-binding domain-containing protein [Hydrogenovibrio sp.]MDR9498886.1 tyrosine-type recombinase/integrase [Hydrogenovibrio sp.]
MKLTDTAIRKKKPNGRVQKMSDGGGLRLEVTAAGSKVFKYRFKLEGKDSDYVIGQYPVVSLAEARQLRDQAKHLVRQGLNPNDVRKKEREEIREAEDVEEGMTLRDLYEEYADFKTTAYGDREPDWHVSTLEKHTLRFEKHVFPTLGAKPIEQLHERDLEECLLQVQQRGALVNRNKIKSVFNMLFRYAKSKRYIERDIGKYVSDALFVKHARRHYKHLTTPEEIKDLLQRLDNLQASYVVYQCLQLAVLVFARPGEVTRLKWSEINLNAGYIEKDASSMKKRRSFLIPLSKQSLSILEKMEPLTGHTEFVFDSPYGTGKPITTESLNNALRRNGIHEVNPHGFRHMASTTLNELGFDADEIELQLSHVISGVRGIYNKSEKLKQRFALMQAWADYLDRLRIER